MKVFLAARYSRADEMQGYARQLSAAGFTVTSRWIAGEAPRDADGLSVRLEDEARTLAAVLDCEDLAEADICISFTEEPRSGGRGGRHAEFGMGVATGRISVVVGPREHVFHHLPAVHWFPNWEEAFAGLTILLWEGPWADAEIGERLPPWLRPGDLALILPGSHPVFGGAVMVVQSVRAWGVTGYVPMGRYITGENTADVAPFRAGWGQIVRVGRMPEQYRQNAEADHA